MTEQQDMPSAPEPGLGTRLRLRRESLGLSLEMVAKRTCIRRGYLCALEAERFEDLPALAYAVGFLRTYAGLLGLDPEQVVAEFRQVAASDSVFSERDDGPSPALPDRLVAARKGRRRWWLVMMLVLGAALAAGRLDLFERPRQNAPAGESPSAATEDTVLGGDAAPVAREAEGRVAPPRDDGAVPVAGDESPAGGEPAPKAEDESLSTAEGHDNPGAMTVPLPPGGAVFRVKSGGTGRLRIIVDDLAERQYAMYPEMAMSWSIRRFARVRVNIAGELQAWLDDRPLVLGGDAEVVFGLMGETP